MNLPDVPKGSGADPPLRISKIGALGSAYGHKRTLATQKETRFGFFFKLAVYLVFCRRPDRATVTHFAGKSTQGAYNNGMVTARC